MSEAPRKPEFNDIARAVLLIVVTLAANFTWSAATGLPAVARDVAQMERRLQTLETKVDMLVECASEIETRVSVSERDLEWIKPQLDKRRSE